MTNKEWLMSLNKQQRRRRRNKGEIPEFAIYRVYNHSAKQWQFTDIISTSKAKAQLELKNDWVLILLNGGLKFSLGLYIILLHMNGKRYNMHSNVEVKTFKKIQY